MGYHIELNSLLVIPDNTLDLDGLELGKRYRLAKEHERLYPLNVPLDFCNAAYRYCGKAVIHKITLEKDKTTLEFEVLKLYTNTESEVFSSNFIPL